MKLASCFKGIKPKIRLPRFAHSRLSLLIVPKRSLEIAFLSLGIISAAFIVYNSQVQAKGVSTIEEKFTIKGTVLTSDQSPTAAKVTIHHDGNSVFETNLAGIGDFETSLVSYRKYLLTVVQEGYNTASNEYTLDKDLEISINLFKIPEPTPVIEAPAPPAPAPTPTPKAPAAKPKTPATTKRTPAPRQTSQSAPGATATPAPTPSVRTDLSHAGILDQINAQRRANGLGAITLNNTLSSAALAKAKHMADNNYFAHVAPDGTDDWSFIAQAGYTYRAAGVNLAMGSFGSGQALVDAWMNSSGHRANILASFGREVGIGMYGKYYVMIIAS